MPSEPTIPQALGEELSPGFNVIGFLHAVNGLAEAARLMIGALELTGIPFVTVDYAASPSKTGADIQRRADGIPIHDTTLLCVNADMTPTFVAEAGAELLINRYTIGNWAWETEEFPPRLLGALDFVDEVWMPSNYARDAVRRVTTKPVHTVGYPIVAPTLPEDATRARLGIPEGFVFSFCFDYFSVAKRKNAVGLVEAYRRAFSGDEGTHLVIKTLNADREPEQAEKLREAASGRSDIVLIDRYMPAADKNAFIALSDCYVSLHRSEGFGLTLAEAMALGRPVIGTGYSGNLDFMTEENSYLVAWKPTLVGDDAGIYPAGARWAEPDLDDAARLMRHVFEHQDEAAAKARRAMAVAETHSSAVQARFIKRRFEELAEMGPSVRQSGNRWTYAAAMHKAAAALDRGPDIEMRTQAGGPYAGVAKAYRSLLKLAMRNSWVHQRDVGNLMLDAIRELDARRQKEAASTAHEISRLTDEVARLSRVIEESTGRQSRA